MIQDIPVGRTKEDIKAREQIIKDFYAQWIAEHPDKKVFNITLGKHICVKFLSINETYEKAYLLSVILAIRNSLRSCLLCDMRISN